MTEFVAQQNIMGPTGPMRSTRTYDLDAEHPQVVELVECGALIAKQQPVTAASMTEQPSVNVETHETPLPPTPAQRPSARIGRPTTAAE